MYRSPMNNSGNQVGTYTPATPSQTSFQQELLWKLPEASSQELTLVAVTLIIFAGSGSRDGGNTWNPLVCRGPKRLGIYWGFGNAALALRATSRAPK